MKNRVIKSGDRGCPILSRRLDFATGLDPPPTVRRRSRRNESLSLRQSTTPTGDRRGERGRWCAVSRVTNTGTVSTRRGVLVEILNVQ